MLPGHGRAPPAALTARQHHPALADAVVRPPGNVSTTSSNAAAWIAACRLARQAGVRSGRCSPHADINRSALCGAGQRHSAHVLGLDGEHPHRPRGSPRPPGSEQPECVLEQLRRPESVTTPTDSRARRSTRRRRHRAGRQGARSRGARRRRMPPRAGRRRARSCSTPSTRCAEARTSASRAPKSLVSDCTGAATTASARRR